MVESERCVQSRAEFREGRSGSTSDPGGGWGNDQAGRHLKEALDSGKQIIITTVQRFAVVLEQIRKMEDGWKKAQQQDGNDPGDSEKPTFYKPESVRFALRAGRSAPVTGGDFSMKMKKALRIEWDEEELSPTELALKD